MSFFWHLVPTLQHLFINETNRSRRQCQSRPSAVIGKTCKMSKYKWIIQNTTECIRHTIVQLRNSLAPNIRWNLGVFLPPYDYRVSSLIVQMSTHPPEPWASAAAALRPHVLQEVRPAERRKLVQLRILQKQKQKLLKTSHFHRKRFKW